MQHENSVGSRRLANALIVSQIVSLLALPIVLALAGFWVQKSLQEQQIRRDYVSLAVSMLAPKKEGEKETPQVLRSWAIALLNETAPVKLTQEQAISLKHNGLSLKPGDIVLLDGKRKMSIYLGDDRFIRSNENGKVEVQSLQQSLDAPDK
jgi:cell wall-associated NlpC family hydrolase